MTVHSSPFSVSQLGSLAYHRATQIQPSISPMSPIGPIAYLSTHARDATVNRELLTVNREPEPA